MGLAYVQAIQKLAGTTPRKETALRAGIFMSWLKPRPTKIPVLKNRRKARPSSAQRIQLVLENRHTPPQGRCGCVPCESGSQEMGTR